MNHARILSELVRSDQLRVVEKAVVRVVAGSFYDERVRGEGIIVGEVRATETEVRHRTNICYDWFIRMRRECGYSTIRALDLLKVALRSELDGIPWLPPPPDRSWSGKQ